MYSLVRACDMYIRNPDYSKYILKFMELSCTLIFSLNNKHYKNNFNIDQNTFYENIFDDIDDTNIINISMIPTFLIKNIINASLLLRKYYPETLINNLESTKILLYFSLAYSSHIELINNPHLRSEILDIMIYFLIVNQQERNYKQSRYF